VTHDRRRHNKVRAGMADTRVRAALVQQMRWQLPDLFLRARIVYRSNHRAKRKIIVARIGLLNEPGSDYCSLHQDMAFGQRSRFCSRTPRFFPDRVQSGRDSLPRFFLPYCRSLSPTFGHFFSAFYPAYQKSFPGTNNFCDCEPRALPSHCAKLTPQCSSFLRKIDNRKRDVGE
jgi:hypothetical protein